VLDEDGIRVGIGVELSVGVGVGVNVGVGLCVDCVLITVTVGVGEEVGEVVVKFEKVGFGEGLGVSVIVGEICIEGDRSGLAPFVTCLFFIGVFVGE